ncbi:MAG: energy-coupling factor ABC transporter ATP-binding protein [Proteobacteria bacterium]|nr:energy-coupling factor ABC transporter ATP-binding protein [Pseudomonadota bacterium]MBU1904334.1 energy-coupling factor ABC transporter ATP-binding protein [Pseudomonadota bacterium]
MGSNQLIINLENISFTYPNRAPVLDELTLRLSKGERLGLVGPNGSGKTTLFHIIMGLLKPCSGRIEILGRPVTREKDFREVRKKIGLLFQDADDQLFSPTVLEDVAFGPLNLGKSHQEARDISVSTLKMLGLGGLVDRITYNLSGGEKRLVSLATVLAMEPEALLLDEPSNGLDDDTKEKLIDVLSGLDLSYILITHEADFLARTVDHTCRMEDGKILTDHESYLHYHLHEHEQGKYPHKHE